MEKTLLNFIAILYAVQAIGNEDSDQGSSNMTMVGLGDTSTDNDSMGYEQISMWDGIDVAVVAFFVVAAVWLFLSIIYSIILLLLLKMQAQGRLDLDDENFGRLECFNGFFGLNLGCIARRYVVRMARNDGHPPQSSITRMERRAALEIILKTTFPVSKGVMTDGMESNEGDGENNLVDENEALCSICLSGYEKSDMVITTKCDHQFHRECLMKWLERQNNSECPVCRETLYTEETIWENVKIMRKRHRKKGIFQRVTRVINFKAARTMQSQLEGQSSNSMTDEDELSDVEQTHLSTEFPLNMH